MQITKAIFDEILPGEIFRVVTTRVQGVDAPMKEILQFVCLKARLGEEWVIYFGSPTAHPNDLARYGIKVEGKENILSICPCNAVVLGLYQK